LTYQLQGTMKRGVKPQDHAIIYTEEKGPKRQKVREAAGEEKLQKQPIRVEPASSRDRLDPLSRLNYAKIYTVENNVKVCFIGRIHKKSVAVFIKDYNLTHRPLPETEDPDYSDDEKWKHLGGAED
jgi:hypothetical protein